MTEHSKSMIVGFGEALIDVLPTGEVVGGAPLNMSLRSSELAKPLGMQATLLTRIGDDARGQAILSVLNQCPLDTSHIQIDPQLETGYVDVELNAGQPDYRIGENVAWDAIANNAKTDGVLTQASAICFGTLAQRSTTSRQTLHTLLNAATGAVKVLDLNLRKPLPTLAIVRYSLEAAHILKCNEEELHQLAAWFEIKAARSATAIASELMSLFSLRCVFWTQGARGCHWQDKDQVLSLPVPQLPPRHADADSVGAGDAASAALTVGLIANWSPERIVRAANLCGAFAANSRGPTTPLPDSFINDLLEV